MGTDPTYSGFLGLLAPDILLALCFQCQQLTCAANQSYSLDPWPSTGHHPLPHDQPEQGHDQVLNWAEMRVFTMIATTKDPYGNPEVYRTHMTQHRWTKKPSNLACVQFPSHIPRYSQTYPYTDRLQGVLPIPVRN